MTPPTTAQDRVRHNDRCASLLGQGCDCRDPFTALATCECAVSQIRPAWDGHERLVCEDCHGRIARANKPLGTGQIDRPGELDCAAINGGPCTCGEPRHGV